MPTLREVCDSLEDADLPEGHGVRIIGGRKVYSECGTMWRNSPNYCFVAGKRSADVSWDKHEKSRRYLPDDTPVEIVPLPVN